MTEPTQESAQNTGIPNVVIGAVCALSGLVVSAFVVLMVLGKSTDILMTIVGTLIVPTIVALLGVKKLSNFEPVIHDIALKVNGRLDSALTAIKALEAQVLASGGTPVTTPTIVVPSPVVTPQHSAENPPADVPNPRTVQEVTAANG